MKRLFHFLLPVCLLLGGGVQAGERFRPPPGGGRALHPIRERMTLDDAVSHVRRQVEGRVLSAEERNGEYRVRILTPQGRVKRFRLDPRTGRYR